MQSTSIAMNIGILGAGKVGSSIAALLDVAGFVDSVIIGDAQMVNNLDGLRKVRFRQLDVLAASELEDFVRAVTLS